MGRRPLDLGISSPSGHAVEVTQNSPNPAPARQVLDEAISMCL